MVLPGVACAGSFFFVEGRQSLRVPRAASLVPGLNPINTGRRTIVHGGLYLSFRGAGRVVNDSFLVSVSVVTVLHAEDLRADLGTDFTANTAFGVNRRCA